MSTHLTMVAFRTMAEIPIGSTTDIRVITIPAFKLTDDFVVQS